MHALSFVAKSSCIMSASLVMKLLLRLSSKRQLSAEVVLILQQSKQKIRLQGPLHFGLKEFAKSERSVMRKFLSCRNFKQRSKNRSQSLTLKEKA